VCDEAAANVTAAIATPVFDPDQIEVGGTYPTMMVAPVTVQLTQYMLRPGNVECPSELSE